jgi:hypothetical protein
MPIHAEHVKPMAGSVHTGSDDENRGVPTILGLVHHDPRTPAPAQRGSRHEPGGAGGPSGFSGPVVRIVSVTFTALFDGAGVPGRLVRQSHRFGTPAAQADSVTCRPDTARPVVTPGQATPAMPPAARSTNGSPLCQLIRQLSRTPRWCRAGMATTTRNRRPGDHGRSLFPRDGNPGQAAPENRKVNRPARRIDRMAYSRPRPGPCRTDPARKQFLITRSHHLDHALLPRGHGAVQTPSRYGLSRTHHTPPNTRPGVVQHRLPPSTPTKVCRPVSRSRAGHRCPISYSCNRRRSSGTCQ